MEMFIHRQNILFFRKQLAEQPTETRRLQLMKLLAEEEAKPVALHNALPAFSRPTPPSAWSDGAAALP